MSAQGPLARTREGRPSGRFSRALPRYMGASSQGQAQIKHNDASRRERKAYQCTETFLPLLIACKFACFLFCVLACFLRFVLACLRASVLYCFLACCIPRFLCVFLVCAFAFLLHFFLPACLLACLSSCLLASFCLWFWPVWVRRCCSSFGQLNSVSV